MKMSELIAAYGDKNLLLQNLDESTKKIDWSANKGSPVTTITFGTTASISTKPGEGMEKLGLVLWFDRKRVAEILAASKGGGDE